MVPLSSIAAALNQQSSSFELHEEIWRDFSGGGLPQPIRTCAERTYEPLVASAAPVALLCRRTWVSAALKPYALALIRTALRREISTYFSCTPAQAAVFDICARIASAAASGSASSSAVRMAWCSSIEACIRDISVFGIGRRWVSVKRS